MGFLRGKSNGYVSLEGQFVRDDFEKRFSLDDFSSESSYTSGDGAESQIGLLSPTYSPARRKHTHLRHSMVRRRFSRYLTSVLLGTSILSVVLYLARQQALSDNLLRNSEPPPPPPPTWESFPFLKRYHGGVRSIVSRDANKPEYPDPARELEIGDPAQWNTTDSLQKRDNAGLSRAFSPFSQENGLSDRKECFVHIAESRGVPPLRVHRGVPDGMPDPVFGSYDMFGLQNDACFDRFGRLGQYGFGYGSKFGGAGVGLEGEGQEEAMRDVWGDEVEIDYSAVKWADAQEACVAKNMGRLKWPKKARKSNFPAFDSSTADEDTYGTSTDSAKAQAGIARTAVLIRTWSDYEYDAEDILNLRAIINEAALQSGGEYSVHFLIHVKDDNLQIWADDEVYQQTLDKALPEEFRGMGSLWSERQMALIYGGLDETWYRGLYVHGVYRSTFMPVQYFAHTHPEYDLFWHWEMDIRYIGHYYHLFDRLGAWAKKQPRKGLWERNSRFYVPSEHGSWEDFHHMVRVQTEHGTSHRENMYQHMSKDPKHPDDVQVKPETPVWGPLRPQHESDQFETHNDPVPPTTYAEDQYEWGVGEEADLITLNPLFDPDQTNWILAEDVSGYNTTGGHPPRRTAIVTSARLSRRLLETMHRETALGRHSMFSEMWPGSCALHHGLKAVYAPHPVYIDRRWPTSYLAAVFNNGRNGASGGARTSVFSDERQHNFLGTTWYYHAGFPANLWKRWLGYRVDGDGGEQEEEAGEGRMCLPSMLLHPVKHVDMIYESKDEARHGASGGDLAA